jgi:hypothetical protein
LHFDWCKMQHSDAKHSPVGRKYVRGESVEISGIKHFDPGRLVEGLPKQAMSVTNDAEREGTRKRAVLSNRCLELRRALKKPLQHGRRSRLGVAHLSKNAWHDLAKMSLTTED